MNQPGKVANPVRGQLNRKMNISLSTLAPENLVWRDGFDSCSVPLYRGGSSKRPELLVYILYLNVDTFENPLCSIQPRRLTLGFWTTLAVYQRRKQVAFILLGQLSEVPDTN